MKRARAPDGARKMREIERLIIRGTPIDQTLEAAGVSEADYLSWLAERAGVRLERIAELHAAAREAERRVKPHDYIGHLVPGACPICGTDAGFDNYTENLRESGSCRSCGSAERQRHMAFILRHRGGLGFEGPLKLPSGAVVHNTESTGALHQRLRAAPGYTFSEYWGPQYRSGEMVDGVRHEDLQALSFPDESLDLLLSSDVLEHMPDPYRAHAEVFRVLRPGGAHIFTVPYNFTAEDDVRARMEDGQIRHLREALYHGDPVRPDEGILVWTIFGEEMLDRLKDIGFQAFAWRFASARWGILDTGVVFEARKPLHASPVWLEHQQRLAIDFDRLHAELEAARAELDAERRALIDRESRLRAMEASHSWRLTAPLRAIRALGRRRSG